MRIHLQEALDRGYRGALMISLGFSGVHLRNAG
jgi:hypothetical protein